MIVGDSDPYIARGGPYVEFPYTLHQSIAQGYELKHYFFWHGSGLYGHDNIPQRISVHKQKITIFASAIAALAISGTAGATVISYDSNPTTTTHGVPPTTQVAGATVIDFENQSCAPATCSGDYEITNQPSSSTPAHYARPATDDNGSGRDLSYFLAVPSANHSGSATINLGSGNHYFGLLWGSIDSYNKLTFQLDATNKSETYSGKYLLASHPATVNRGKPTRYVNFFQLPAFHAVTLSSSYYAFESDNLAYSDVPEPGNLVLFGLGALALLVGFRGRFSGRSS
ncbi:PEP-CTERM sorting domain-containing protein [Salinisphaera sp. LB1]|uniref:Npun_F0296 family exosortase-dependent surface protein n=1 Tax=Salinisphaera sp. LB1 TaxID=2183911 RepID=UPI0013149287|nr:PEP-CTERM sorting domain-containing protein [Salinisphaera sp. LB1]